MPSPFPGMDSYLEHPDFWQETHHFVNLPELFAGIYDRAGYDCRSDCDREPIPSLAEEDRIWANKVLQEKELRDN